MTQPIDNSAIYDIAAMEILAVRGVQIGGLGKGCVKFYFIVSDSKRTFRVNDQGTSLLVIQDAKS